MEGFIVFMIIFLIILSFWLIFYLDVYRYVTGDGYITTESAKNKINKNEIDYIIDIRSDREWQMGHYNTAIHIPLDELDIEEMLPDDFKEKTILIYCRTGRRARQGYNILKGMGAKKVYYINDSYKSLN